MSCSFHLPRVGNVRSSDTLSEVSEGTTNSGWTSGWDSREDLRDFVTKIGLGDTSELFKERFCVDRRKLELMLSDDREALLPADMFFEQIMEDTNTFITWPTKLKVGAKSKKDPHVRIAGRREDVEVAKERIIAVLDTRSNRVTMKMDVSYTDHSHIIGKGGHSIRRVMDETQCHVHFPDSNRSNTNEKSNQVSVAGDIQGAELARSRVRQITPVIFGFELPIMSQTVDPCSNYVIKIQEQYGVQMILRTRPKLHATLVLVKGNEWEVESVKQATKLLVEYLCGHLANKIPIQMTMQISPIHHPMVIGKHHQNIKDIMQTTGTQILFPDALDPNIPILKKSNVTITGNIHNVYAARQILMGSLPLILMFDLPESLSGYKPEDMIDIQNKFDVSINVRHKGKHNSRVCIIKGAERNASDIYRARNAVLGVDEPKVMADIPSSYALHSQTPSSDLLTPTPVNPHPTSPLMSIWQYPASAFAPAPAPVPPFVGLTMGQQSQFLFNCSNAGQSLGSSGYQSVEHMSNSSHSLERGRDSAASNHSSSISGLSSLRSSPISSPRKSNNYNMRSYNDSKDGPEGGNLSNPFASQLSLGLSDLRMGDFASDAEKTSEYDSKRIAGYRAMQSRPTANQVRYPTSGWAGYGLSHTSPAPLGDKVNDKNDDVWASPTKDGSSPTSKMNTSNYIEQTPSYIVNRITSSSWPDLPSLLTSIGCEKYIRLFNSHEVDLATFSSITDEDLIALGVNIFGCRRRMLLAISELNKRENRFSPAPGAERKASSSSSSMSGSYSLHDKW